MHPFIGAPPSNSLVLRCFHAPCSQAHRHMLPLPISTTIHHHALMRLILLQCHHRRADDQLGGEFGLIDCSPWIPCEER